MRQGWGGWVMLSTCVTASVKKFCLDSPLICWPSSQIPNPSKENKNKERKKKYIFYNDVTGLLKPAGKEPGEKSSLTGELLPLSEAASFLWVCNGNKEPVFKRWLKFKALRHTTYCHVRLLENHWFFPLSSSLLFARSAQKVHKHRNKLCVKAKDRLQYMRLESKINHQQMTDCLQTAGS